MNAQRASMGLEEAVRGFYVTRGAHQARAGETAVERRLVACLHADVSGHSRLIADDVEETARRLTVYQDIIGNLVVAHGGRLVDIAGNSLLAAFPTVAPAVRCAVEVQRRLRVHNAELPTHRRMQVRVGIDFGDVLVKDGRLYGDCVNVATRVQEVAGPGRICLAESALDHVSPLLLPCEYLGERAIKDIDRSVRIYQIEAGCGD